MFAVLHWPYMYGGGDGCGGGGGSRGFALLLRLEGVEADRAPRLRRDGGRDGGGGGGGDGVVVGVPPSGARARGAEQIFTGRAVPEVRPRCPRQRPERRVGIYREGSIDDREVPAREREEQRQGRAAEGGAGGGRRGAAFDAAVVEAEVEERGEAAPRRPSAAPEGPHRGRVAEGRNPR